MGNTRHDPLDTELAHGFTIRDYIHARDGQPPDKTTIAEAVYCRFTDRYIKPVSGPCRHGFTIMAVSCLMIEALESFRQGWADTRGKSRCAFCSFFTTFEPFKNFANLSGEFYTHIRCGILHQAETTGGWRIRRDESPLIDPCAHTINADKFLDGLRDSLRKFCDCLKCKEWNSSEWKNVKKKMDAIADNCNRVNGDV